MQLGAYLDEDERTTRRMIDINIYGVHHGAQIALERFVPRGRGHLVNIASMAGKAGYSYGATYCGTKHYVVGLSEALRGETRGTGVEVSVVMPVAVNTELGSVSRRRAASRTSSLRMSPRRSCRRSRRRASTSSCRARSGR